MYLEAISSSAEGVVRPRNSGALRNFRWNFMSSARIEAKALDVGPPPEQADKARMRHPARSSSQVRRFFTLASFALISEFLLYHRWNDVNRTWSIFEILPLGTFLI
jgi:hypothetical protein